MTNQCGGSSKSEDWFGICWIINIIAAIVLLLFAAIVAFDDVPASNPKDLLLILAGVNLFFSLVGTIASRLIAGRIEFWKFITKDMNPLDFVLGTLFMGSGLIAVGIWDLLFIGLSWFFSTRGLFFLWPRVKNIKLQDISIRAYWRRCKLWKSCRDKERRLVNLNQPKGIELKLVKRIARLQIVLTRLTEEQKDLKSLIMQAGLKGREVVAARLTKNRQECQETQVAIQKISERVQTLKSLREQLMQKHRDEIASCPLFDQADAEQGIALSLIQEADAEIAALQRTIRETTGKAPGELIVPEDSTQTVQPSTVGGA